MADVFIYTTTSRLDADVLPAARRVPRHYVYASEGACLKDATDRIEQGELVTMGRYERVGARTTAFATVWARPPFGRGSTGCEVGYASLRAAHEDGARGVTGYAPALVESVEDEFSHPPSAEDQRAARAETGES
jgi:hypothetical protein